MPTMCVRPLCSATVFSCNTASFHSDTYTVLVDEKRSYSREEYMGLRLDEELSLVTGKYRGRYRYVVIGAPSGGAAQLASIYGAPLLPCNILTPVPRRNPGDPDDIDDYLSDAIELSRGLAARIRGVADILIHYDPIHDRGWVARELTIRIHLKALPEAYRRFMENHLEPGATIIYIDVKHPWLQFRVDDNIYVQIGGADGIGDTEYIHGGRNLEEAAEALGAPSSGWWSSILDSATRERLPESEWGSRQGLRRSVEEYAEQHGLGLVVIEAASFYNTMVLGTAAYLSTSLEPRGVLVENYKQSASTTMIKKHLVPVWSVFTTRASLRYTERILRHLAGERGVGGEALYVTVPYGYIEQGFRWPDATRLSEWREMLNRYFSETTMVPGTVTGSETTRTLDAMNKIYREAWMLSKKLPRPTYSVDTAALLQEYRRLATLTG